MIVQGYFNRYQPGLNIMADYESADSIPADTNIVETNTFVDGLKLITYEVLNGVQYKTVYIANDNTKGRYTHIYSVVNGIVMVNLLGVSLITGKHVMSIANCVLNRMCSYAADNGGDVDHLQLMVLSNREYITNTEDNLTTLDLSNYVWTIRNIRDYIREMYSKSRVNREMYERYAFNMNGDVTHDAFCELPRTIYDVLNRLDIVFDKTSHVNTLLSETLNSIPCPENYKKYDGKIRRLVDNGYMSIHDHTSGRTTVVRRIVHDEYNPVYAFSDILIKYCAEWMEENEFTRKYILSFCNNKRLIALCKYLLDVENTVTPGGIPITAYCNMVVCKTIAEEVFIDIETTRGTYKYFIDLTLVPMICHGVRYKVNEELA